MVQMAKYPEKPTRISGYTEDWITEYLKDKATARQINKYIKAIDGKDKKERRQIFVDMFIAEKALNAAKPAKKSFDDNLKDLLKEKRAEEKANKE
jgi:hypothetical protein